MAAPLPNTAHVAAADATSRSAKSCWRGTAVAFRTSPAAVVPALKPAKCTKPWQRLCPTYKALVEGYRAVARGMHCEFELSEAQNALDWFYRGSTAPLQGRSRSCDRYCKATQQPV